MNQTIDNKSLRHRFLTIGIVTVAIILFILIGTMLRSFYMEYEIVGRWKPYNKDLSPNIRLILHSENSWEYIDWGSGYGRWGTWNRDGILIKMKTDEDEFWAKIVNNDLSLPPALTQKKSPMLFRRIKE